MPRIEFSAMPDRARLWVFVADVPVPDPSPLLDAVDAHLAQWNAHGVPLVSGRELRDQRFLAIAVDEAATGASGCSIDGMFRTLGRVQTQVGADLLASGRIAWRDARGSIRVSSRAEFEALAAAGTISSDTRVYSTLAETVGEWRTRFEVPARESWVRSFLP
jgi:hypothetical protein